MAVCRVVADTIKKKRRQLSGEGGSWSVVVALHRHPRFMASHGWADWVEGGVAGSPERATVSVVPRAASWWVPVCGGRRWGTGRGTLISRPEHRTLGLPSGYEGGGG